MAITINWQFQATVQGGPALITNQPPISVGAYDVIQVTIPAATAGVAVHVQPSAAVGEVLFLTVTSSAYDPGLTYTVDAVATIRALDAPHVFLGAGAAGFLNSAGSPQLLTFGNTLASPVNIQVLVGRKVP